jgi:hypothetical protein
LRSSALLSASLASTCGSCAVALPSSTSVTRERQLCLCGVGGGGQSRAGGGPVRAAGPRPAIRPWRQHAQAPPAGGLLQG